MHACATHLLLDLEIHHLPEGRRQFLLREVPVDELPARRRLGVEGVDHAKGLGVTEDEPVVVA